jgi:hypothetical protein
VEGRLTYKRLDYGKGRENSQKANEKRANKYDEKLKINGSF